MDGRDEPGGPRTQSDRPQAPLNAAQRPRQLARALGDPARLYAARLCDEAGAPNGVPASSKCVAIDPRREWARSGAMELTGRTDGLPRLVAPPVASCMRGAWLALRGCEPGFEASDLDAAGLLGERAALFSHSRRGPVAPGGAARMLRTRDGWLAVNLPRSDDWRSLSAWLQADQASLLRDALRSAPDGGSEPWQSDACWQRVAEQIELRGSEELVERARWLGLAVAPVGAADALGVAVGWGVERGEPPPWLARRRLGRPQLPSSADAPLVVDLSSLWAGPLCTQLLRMAGARVVKVEDVERPDGARRGVPAFFDLLHAGSESVALPLRAPEGIAALRALIARADVVVESARPRALQQLGIVAEAELSAHPGLVWLSISGYGRSGEAAHAVAFGDDAAAAAGLVALDPDDAEPLFCGDAIADPLAGLHAALAVAAARRRGGGELLEVSLVGVAARVVRFGATFGAPASSAAVREVAGRAMLHIEGAAPEPVAPPRARPVAGRAPPLGADTARVLAELGA